MCDTLGQTDVFIRLTDAFLIMGTLSSLPPLFSPRYGLCVTVEQSNSDSAHNGPESD